MGDAVSGVPLFLSLRHVLYSSRRMLVGTAPARWESMPKLGSGVHPAHSGRNMHRISDVLLLAIPNHGVWVDRLFALRCGVQPRLAAPPAATPKRVAEKRKGRAARSCALRVNVSFAASRAVVGDGRCSRRLHGTPQTVPARAASPQL